MTRKFRNADAERYERMMRAAGRTASHYESHKENAEAFLQISAQPDGNNPQQQREAYDGKRTKNPVKLADSLSVSAAVRGGASNQHGDSESSGCAHADGAATPANHPEKVGG